MSEASNKPVSQTMKNITRAFLIVGLVISINVFLGSIGLLLLYFGIYIAAIVAVIYVYAYALISVFAAVLVVYFIIFIFAALLGASNFDFLGSLGIKLDELIPPEILQKLGQYTLYYLIALPIIILFIISSFISMIFAIVALARLNKAKSKAGGVVGGIFGILSAFTGLFSLIELMGSIMMFFISGKEYAAGHEEKTEEEEMSYPRQAITQKEVIDFTDK